MPFIILDRDGVINHESNEYIKSPEEWLPIPGSLEAIACLNRAGYRILVATNQAGIAHGLYDLAMLERIHTKLHQTLKVMGGKIEEILICPHGPQDGCTCRKPNPGLLFKIKEKYPIDLHQTFFIGDSLRDIEAAERAGVKPILVLTGNGQQFLDTHPRLHDIPHFADLAHAVQYVLAKTDKDE